MTWFQSIPYFLNDGEQIYLFPEDSYPSDRLKVKFRETRFIDTSLQIWIDDRRVPKTYLSSLGPSISIFKLYDLLNLNCPSRLTVVDSPPRFPKLIIPYPLGKAGTLDKCRPLINILYYLYLFRKIPKGMFLCTTEHFVPNCKGNLFRKSYAIHVNMNNNSHSVDRRFFSFLDSSSRTTNVFCTYTDRANNGQVKSHAVLLTISKIKHTIELFDPNGNCNAYRINKLIEKLKLIRHPSGKGCLFPQKFIYRTISPFRSFQKLENHKGDNCRPDDYSGYCSIWRFWFLELRLANPDIPTDILIRGAMIKIFSHSSQNPFLEFIRDYTYSIQIIAKKEALRLKIPFKIPISKASFDKINKQIKLLIES